jgi:hypothetical protein
VYTNISPGIELSLFSQLLLIHGWDGESSWSGFVRR